MFTGIIETQGIVKQITSSGSNKTLWIGSPVSAELKIDQSVSHNGVCLTVEEVKENGHRVTVIKESLQKTNFEACKINDIVNLERCLLLNSRLDGHLVQGHVDTTGTCIHKKEKAGSWEFEFEFSSKFADLVIEKGSICVNGISLTCFNVKKKKFSVAIIPYTFEHTNIRNVTIGDKVNLEFDIIGKYMQRSLSLKKK